MPNMAVKVLDAGDKAYLKFLEWARRNQHNPYVPTVYDVVYVDVINNHGYVIVFLEMLKDLNSTEYDIFLEELQCKHLNYNSLLDARDSVQSDELRTLLNYLVSKQKLLDLHQANFMRRGDHIVFTDPICQ